jgi:hypothetical protein
MYAAEGTTASFGVSRARRVKLGGDSVRLVSNIRTVSSSVYCPGNRSRVVSTWDRLTSLAFQVPLDLAAVCDGDNDGQPYHPTTHFIDILPIQLSSRRSSLRLRARSFPGSITPIQRSNRLANRYHLEIISCYGS